jgi:tRNA dimethylallyltransferase
MSQRHTVSRLRTIFARTQIQSRNLHVNEDAKRVLIIAGPTAVGKSSVSVELAKRIGAEVINADSVQMYQECKIGSNRITHEEMQQVKHHLMDSLSLKDSSSIEMSNLGGFIRAVNQIIENSSVPTIITGGSAYYLHHFMKGSQLQGPKSSHSIEERRQIVQKLKNEGNWGNAIEMLRKHDPNYASTIERNNYERLARALQIVTTTGQPLLKNEEQSAYDIRGIVLTMDRLKLYRRIDERCEEIVEKGLIEEVHALMRSNLLNPNAIPWTAIGYRQAIELLQKHSLIERKHFLQFLTNYKTVTRNYAKRQYSWYRRNDSEYKWLDLDKIESPVSEIERLWQLPRADFLNEVHGAENHKLISENVGIKVDLDDMVSKSNKKQFIQQQLDHMYLYKDHIKMQKRIDHINNTINQTL